MIKVIAIVGIAYVLTGVHYVWRDMRADVMNQPAYVHGGLAALALTAVGWLPAVVIFIALRGVRSRHIFSCALFIGLTCAGFLLIRN